MIEDTGISSLTWPGNSPDLNPIEHLWHAMKKKVAQQKPQNQIQLISALDNVWHNVITEDTLRVLVDSMPSRIKAVIQARGGVTRY